MADHSQQIVQKLWNYCNVLRDDGLSCGDYVEQLTFLLFLKMAHERSDLDDFVKCYHAENRHARTATWSERARRGAGGPIPMKSWCSATSAAWTSSG